MGTRSGSAVVLLAAVLLAGCGSEQEVVQVPDAPSPRPGPSDLARTPSAAPGPAEQLLRGTVVAGVEQGCLLLRTRDGEHLLVGGDRALMVPGAQLEVRGRAVPDLLTTCQQGVPFEVSSAVAVLA